MISELLLRMLSYNNNNQNSIALTGFLATFKITEAQVFAEGGYYPVTSDRSITITNKEYPNPYPKGSARQAKIRAPHFYKIEMECHVFVEVKSFFQ